MTTVIASSWLDWTVGVDPGTGEDVLEVINAPATALLSRVVLVWIDGMQHIASINGTEALFRYRNGTLMINPTVGPMLVYREVAYDADRDVFIFVKL